MSSIIEISESVRLYYGQVLQSSSDLKTKTIKLLGWLIQSTTSESILPG